MEAAEDISNFLNDASQKESKFALPVSEIENLDIKMERHHEEPSKKGGVAKSEIRMYEQYFKDNVQTVFLSNSFEDSWIQLKVFMSSNEIYLDSLYTDFLNKEINSKQYLDKIVKVLGTY